MLLASYNNAELVFSTDGRLVLPVRDGQAVRYGVLSEGFDAADVVLRGDYVERAGTIVRREGDQLVIEVVNPSRQPVLIESLLLRKRARARSRAPRAAAA